jgi:serine/threonine-protein kinase
LVDAERLSERYVLLERIAVGGMGSVYGARDERLDRSVAIKVLKDDLAHDPRFVERFRREARSAGALSHPNVAEVYDYGQEGDRHFIVMELVEGRDLSRVLREEGPLAPERAAAIGAAVARALEHAHAAGVVHRDVKPANVMVTPGDRVKVTDFGIARATGESTLTATGSVMGTAQYISPEQAAGEPVTARSDIYSLGIVLFEMLTGSVPFTGDSALAVAMKHVNERVPTPSSLNRNVPAALDTVTLTATEREPHERYSDAGALGAALEATAIELEAGGDTDVIATEEHDQSVWPIPGSRYDPEKLGKRVIGALLTLAFIALALFIWRVVTAEEPARDRQRQGQAAPTADAASPPSTSPEQTETPPATPTGFTLADYVGANFKDVEKALEEAGLSVDKVDVDDEAPKDTILGQDPPPDTVLQEGDTVTLTVSSGKPPEAEPDDDDDDESEGPGRGPDNGKAKGKDKEEEDD